MADAPRASLEPVDPRVTPYARLGFARPLFALDAKALERAWLERSRKLHPDRFARASDAERRLAAEHTVALNEAYRALKDPYDRAVWLVRHAGVDPSTLDQPLLMELMVLRERAEEGPAARTEVVADARARFRVLEDELRALLTRVDAEADGYSKPSEPLRRAAKLLAEMKTLARLVDDLDGPHGQRLISTLDAR